MGGKKKPHCATGRANNSPVIRNYFRGTQRRGNPASNLINLHKTLIKNHANKLKIRLQVIWIVSLTVIREVAQSRQTD